MLCNKYFPDRKVLGFGISGLLAFGIMQWLGIPMEQALMYANGIGAVVMYALPPSAHDVIKRLDAIVKDSAIPLVPPAENEHV